MTDRIRQIRLASWVGIIINGLLAVFIVTSGVISGSLSVVASGIDSTGDVLISILTLSISYLLSRPPNAKFPYGYGKAEPNATIALSFLIFFAGAQLAISSVKRLLDDSTEEIPGKLAIIAIIGSVIVKIFLSMYQKRMSIKTQSNMLLAYAKNMQGDVVISISVLLGLVLSHVFNLAILDIIFAFGVSLWVMWVAIKIFIETNLELMDGNIEQRVYKQVFDIVESVPEVNNPHRMRIRKVGHRLMINIDIELDGEMLVKHAHELSHVIERKIRDELNYEVFDVIIHSEPHGDEIEETDLGISRDVLEK